MVSKRQVFSGITVMAAFLLASCGGGGDAASPPPLSAVQQCGLIGAYFCTSSQANLQPPGGFQDKSLGYCMVGAGGFSGSVGYSATTFNGGADLVTTQTQANNDCNLFNQGGQRLCPGYSQCVR
jgi:hypothetical protein